MLKILPLLVSIFLLFSLFTNAQNSIILDPSNSSDKTKPAPLRNIVDSGINGIKVSYSFIEFNSFVKTHNKYDFSISYISDLKVHTTGEFANFVGSWSLPDRSFFSVLSQGTHSGFIENQVPLLALDDEPTNTDYYGDELELGVHKVVVVFRASGSKMYIDDVDTYILRPVVDNQPTNLEVALKDYNDQPIKDFKVFNKALSNEEVIREFRGSNTLTQPMSEDNQKELFKQFYKATERILVGKYPNIPNMGTYPLATLEQLED